MQFQIITTVVTAATSYDLTALQTVKDELGELTNNNDALLKRYISNTSAAAAQYCNRVFPVETVSDSFNPWRDAGRVLFHGRQAPLQLSRWPIVAITSVTENGVLLVEGTDFVTDKTNGQLTRYATNTDPTLPLLPTPWWSLPIVVVYSAGYSPIPLDVDDAIVRMVTRRFATKGRDPNLKQQNVPGVIEQSWWIATGTESGNLSVDIADILDNYRVPLAA
jgi:hypothetical protein